jgi:competence protein ComEA
VGLVVGLTLLGAGVFVWKSGVEPEVEIIKAESMEETSMLVVDVEGAVEKPGVYSLKNGSRIEDAVNIAGGMSVKADVRWVELNVNRAQILTDGYKLYIPKLGETGVMEANVKGVSNLINVNSGTSAQLESLPGVGPVTATKIIQGRPFGKVEELLDKKIVGKKVYEQIKSLISL